MNDQSDRDYWNRHAKNYDLSMLLLGKPIPRMVALSADAVVGAERVLEVAAGTGLLTAALARGAQELVATDYAPAMAVALESRVRALGLANVRCEQADLVALRFEPASFDVVVAANVLHLVPDLPGALASLRRVLKPRGRLLVPTYCHDETAFSRILSRALALTGFPGRRRFSARSLGDSLTAEGLHIEHEEVLPGVIPITYIQGCFEKT